MRRSDCSSPSAPCSRSSSSAQRWDRPGAALCSWRSCPARSPLLRWRHSVATTSPPNCVRRYRIRRCPTRWRRSRPCRRSRSSCLVGNQVKPTITTGCAAMSCRSTTTESLMPCALSRKSGWLVSRCRWCSARRPLSRPCTGSALCQEFRCAPSLTSSAAESRGSSQECCSSSRYS
jgi:hypothetical protein